MAAFGEAFSRLAHSPLDASSAAFNEARMGDGIRMLERPQIEQALQQGVAAAAAEAGVPTEQVSRLLPGEELQGVLDRLHKRQEKALRSVRRQEMTVATFAMPDELPTAPNVSEHLTSLASIFSRDKDISSGLRDLAFEIAAWEALLKRCASAIDNDDGLRRSFQRRRALKLLATWGLLAAVLLAAVGVAAFLYLDAQHKQAEAAALAQQQAALALSRQHAEAALALPDPCAPDNISEEDRPRLAPEQLQKLADRQQRCEANKQKQIQQKRCDDLAAHVASNQLSADDTQLAAAAEPTLRRLASHSITAADLLLADNALPCPGSPAESRLWQSLAQAAAAGGPNLWGLAEGVSPRLASVLAVPGTLHQATILAIAFRAEKIATRALKTNRPEDAQRAKAICDLKVKLGQALALSCQRMVK